MRQEKKTWCMKEKRKGNTKAKIPYICMYMCICEHTDTYTEKK